MCSKSDNCELFQNQHHLNPVTPKGTLIESTAKCKKQYLCAKQPQAAKSSNLRSVTVKERENELANTTETSQVLPIRF